MDDTGQPGDVCNETMKCNNTNIKGMLCYTSKLQSTRLQRLENALSKSSSARSRRLAARSSKISTLLSFF